jgi:hypothetical protein
VLKPLREIESDWAKEDGKAFASFEEAEERYKASQRRPKQKPASANETLSHDTLFDGEAPTKPERPKRRRAIVSDATIEALALILADNERGVLGSFDELTGLFGSFDAYKDTKAGKDRSTWLELWNGGSRTIDRVNRGVGQHVPNWSASVLGGIQPAKMQELARRLSTDGLLQRFLVFNGRTVGPGVDRAPHGPAVEGYRELIRKLVAAVPFDAAPVRLSPQAQAHRARVASITEAAKLLTDTSGAMREHFAKWDGLFARVLLVFHAIECVSTGRGLDPVVAGATAESAARLMLGFFLPHAARFYGEVIGRDEHVEHAHWIAGFVLAEKRSEINIRDIYQASWKLRRDRDAIPQAMAMLETAGWAAPVDPGRGKPATKWQISPRVHVVFAERAARERVRREEEKAAVRNAVAQFKGGRAA